VKIANAILLSFLIILTLFAAATYFSYRLGDLVDQNANDFVKSSVVVRVSNRYQRNVLNIASALRGYILTDDPTFLQAYDSAVLENGELLAELDTLVAQPSPQMETLTEIKELNAKWLMGLAKPLLETKQIATVSDSGRIAFRNLYRSAITSGQVVDAQTRIQKKAVELTNYEYAAREALRAQLAESVDRTNKITVYLTAISAVVALLIAIFLSRYLSSRIINMANVASEISKGNYDLSLDTRGNNEISQLARSLTEMSTVLSRNISLLERQNAELNRFAHIVSHDLKAPLRGIDNVVTWIEEDPDFQLSSKMKEYVALIKGRVSRAEALLHGILAYSRAGRETQALEVVNVNELIDEIREYLPKNSGIELQVQPSLPVLKTERLPLLQIFTNLIINAHHHHDKKEGFVRIYYRENQDHLEFFVEDNGPGIAKDYQEKVFQIFQTLRDTESLESTGVGLAIVKKLLDDRKLKVKLDSEVGRGSIFSFEWPKETKQ
jgi:signal transduction histidine kinase